MPINWILGHKSQHLLLRHLIQLLLILMLRMMMTMIIMVMTMTLQMMMEMLAVPMRCLLDTLPFVTRDKKGGVVLDMRVVTLRGRVSFRVHCVRGSVVIFLRDVVRILFIFSFLSFLDTLFLYMRSCNHL